MGNIAFACPSCGQRYNVAAKAQGKVFDCKKCGIRVAVPLMQPAPDNGTRVVKRADGVFTDQGGQPVLQRDTRSYQYDAASSESQHLTPPPPPQVPQQFAAHPGYAAQPPYAQPYPQQAYLQQQPFYHQPANYNQAPGYNQPTGYAAQPQVPAAPAPRRPSRPPAARGQALAQPPRTQGSAPTARRMQRQYTSDAHETSQSPSGRRKKSKTGLIIGLSSGAAAVILVVVLVLVFAGGSDKPGTSTTTTTTVAGADPEAARKEKIKEQIKLLGNDFRYIEDNANKRNAKGLLAAYTGVMERPLEDDAELKARRDQFIKDCTAKLMVALTSNPDKVPLADIKSSAERFVKDGRDDLVRKLADHVVGPSTPYKRYQSKKVVTASGAIREQRGEVDPDFSFFESHTDFKYYELPQDLVDAGIYIGEDKRYVDFNLAIKKEMAGNDKGMYSPEAMQRINELSAPVLARMKELKDAHAKDNFALFAAKSFTRFRRTSQSTLPGEWDYGYSAPFIYFIELEGNTRSLEEIKAGMDRKAVILRDEVKFFEKHVRDAFGLKRTYPKASPDDPEGLEWQKAAPLEIVVLRDDDRYQKFNEDTLGGRIPGARAHYSPSTRQIITWDDPQSSWNKETEWFDISVIIHESWHFLSSIYQDEPIRYKDPKSGKNEFLPLYSTLLVQEGLTDYIAGFETVDHSSYSFGKINHLRLQPLQEFSKQITELWKASTEAAKTAGVPYSGELEWSEGKYASLIDMRGIVQAIAYPLCSYSCTQYLKRLGLGNHPVMFFAYANATGFYYAAGCQASYFFNNYQNGKYRDKYWEFCKNDYTNAFDKTLDIYDLYKQANNGTLAVTPGVKEFMRIFEIKGWDDPRWEELNQEYLKYTIEELVALDVGKGYETGSLDSNASNNDENHNAGIFPGNYRFELPDVGSFHTGKGELTGFQTCLPLAPAAASAWGPAPSNTSPFPCPPARPVFVRHDVGAARYAIKGRLR